MMRLDSVQIGAADLAAATRDHRLLLGLEPARLPNGSQRFQLQRGAVELEAGESGLRALSFVLAGDDASMQWPANEAFHGLQVHATASRAQPAPAAISADGVEAIDHVVVHSPDLPRAVALWRDRLGVRLALDREFPERGLRILFFRSAEITLEFVGMVAPPPSPAGPDRLGGIAYRVANLEVSRRRLLDAGFDVSEIRRGQKRGTVVATVHSRTTGVPTLLIQALE